MPPQPLVDLAQFDLKSVKYGPEEIRRMLPHRGDMALLDGVLMVDKTASLIIGFKDARADEFWCAGHFPGNPLMPGVVQVEAAGQLAVFFYKTMEPGIAERLIVFGGIDNVRFRGSVRPGDRLWIVGKGVEVNRRVAKCAMQGLVNGKVVMEGTIIGIPV